MPRITFVGVKRSSTSGSPCYTVTVRVFLLVLFSLSGFDRIYVEPEPSGEANLEIRNPYGARVVVSVDGVAVGELLPKATGTVENVRAGSHEVGFELPNGFVRAKKVVAE